jgi:lipopolysaccharide/colanic/teichoic acid biosynthesis glycosyltransferase
MALLIEKVLPIKLKYYEQYVQERSLWSDFKIIVKTILVIVKK